MEQHSARFEQPVTLGQHRTHVIDDVHGLRKDDAVELLTVDSSGIAQVGHDRRPWIAIVQIDDLASRHTRAAKALREIALLNFEDVPAISDEHEARNSSM